MSRGEEEPEPEHGVEMPEGLEYLADCPAFIAVARSEVGQKTLTNTKLLEALGMKVRLGDTGYCRIYVHIFCICIGCKPETKSHFVW